MKNVITAFAAVFMIAYSSSINAQNKFEGIVIMKNTGEEGFQGTFTVKENLAVLQTEVKEGKIQMLFDETTGDMTNVIERNGEKVAIKMNMNNNPYLGQMNPKEVYSKDVRDKTATVVVTEETRMIRGYKCVKVEGKDKNSEGIAWVAQGLNLDMTDLVPGAKKYIGNHKTMSDFTGVEGFIMEMQMKDLKTGKEYLIENEVIEQSIPDSFFTSLTEGAEVFDMTDMRQMMLDAQQNPEKMQKMREVMMKLNEE